GGLADGGLRVEVVLPGGGPDHGFEDGEQAALPRCRDEPSGKVHPRLAAVVAAPDDQELERRDPGQVLAEGGLVEAGVLDRSARLLDEVVDGEDQTGRGRQVIADLVEAV